MSGYRWVCFHGRGVVRAEGGRRYLGGAAAAMVMVAAMFDDVDASMPCHDVVLLSVVVWSAQSPAKIITFPNAPPPLPAIRGNVGTSTSSSTTRYKRPLRILCRMPLPLPQ